MGLLDTLENAVLLVNAAVLGLLLPLLLPNTASPVTVLLLLLLPLLAMDA
jgi:hypothetical protein